MEQTKKVIGIGQLGKLEYDVVGMLKIEYPFVISSDKILTVFIYNITEGKIVDASLHDGLVFEIEPEDHIIFQLTCDSNNCTLKIYNVHVKTVTREYSGYDQEEIDGVLIDEVYHVNFERHRFRAFSVDDEAPQILRFVLSYLIPIDLPYQSYHYSSVQEIVQDLKKYFQS